MQFLTVVNLVLIALGPTGTSLGWFSSIFGFGIFALGIVLSALIFFPALFEFFRYGFRQAPKLTIFVGIASLAVIGFSVKLIVENPTNDVSTTLANPYPPQFQTKSFRVPTIENKDLTYPELFFDKSFRVEDAAKVPLAYPNLKPVFYAEPADLTYPKVREVLKKPPEGWKLVQVYDEQRTVELETESTIFKFVQDVIVEIRPNAGDPSKSEAQIRSKIRYLPWDFGSNIQNIETLKTLISGAAPLANP